MIKNTKAFVRNEFERTLKRRKKTLPVDVVDAIEAAFDLDAVQEFIDNHPMINLPVDRQKKIHERRLGKLARGFSEAIASSANTDQITNDDVRFGYSVWTSTSTYKEISGRYYDKSDRVNDCKKAIEAI